jgi:DNA-binding NarL/FixJ family response regulator
MQQKKYNIVIGYTHKLFSDGLESMMEKSEDFTVRECVPAVNILKFLESKNSVDILIIELNYPNKDNLSFLCRIKEERPYLRIMLLSHLAGANISSLLIDSGIDAYLLKSCTKHDMFSALNKIINEKNFFCSDIIKVVLAKNNHTKKGSEIVLTQRESEVLAMLVDCRTNNQIANELCISENTVKTHRKNLLSKFGVNNIFGMIRYACRSRLLDYGPDGFCMGCPHYN